jgi:hypothetical protein
MPMAHQSEALIRLKLLKRRAEGNHFLPLLLHSGAGGHDG